MRVTVQAFLWDTVVGFVTGQFPYDQCLVFRLGEKKNENFGKKLDFCEKFTRFLIKW